MRTLSNFGLIYLPKLQVQHLAAVIVMDLFCIHNWDQYCYHYCSSEVIAVTLHYNNGMCYCQCSKVAKHRHFIVCSPNNSFLRGNVLIFEKTKRENKKTVVNMKQCVLSMHSMVVFHFMNSVSKWAGKSRFFTFLAWDEIEEHGFWSKLWQWYFSGRNY